MTHSRNAGLLVLLLASCVFMLGCGDSSEKSKSTPTEASKPASTPTKHESPQAAFDAAKAAVDKEDWTAFCMCLEPDSRDKYAAGVAMGSTFDIASAESKGDEGKKQADAIKAVFAKHGITEEMLNDDSESKGSPEEAMMDFIKPVKDRVAFIVDMGKANGAKMIKSLPIGGETKLSDVKVDGETAQGTMAFKWIRIIFPMWKTRTPYDENRYQQQLQRRNSPLAKYLPALDKNLRCLRLLLPGRFAGRAQIGERLGH